MGYNFYARALCACASRELNPFFMNIFKTASYSWWQIGLLKFALLSIGLAIGAYWPAVFLPYAVWLAALGALLGLYLAYAWIKQ